MIFRLLIILLIIVFYKPIFNFLKNHKLDSLENIKNTLTRNTKNLVNGIVNQEFHDVLTTVKKIDKNTYKKCFKIIKNMKRIRRDIENDRHIDFKNEFENMKFHRKELLNLLAAMVITHGFFSSHNHIMESADKYLKDMLLELVDIAHKREYNTSWFEPDMEDIEPNDEYAPEFSPQYSLY